MNRYRFIVALLLGGLVILAAALAAARPEPAVPKSPLAGEVWREPITGMEFVRMPGGEYEQGCGEWTMECAEDESPARTVRLSPFWLAKTEVTQGQWKAVMGDNPAYFKIGDDYPVENVSWEQAKAFVRRLNAMSDVGHFRLPSEAEWEYGCRAGGLPLAYGTGTGELNTALANYTLGKPTPVGRYPTNALGLFDMSGNVFEWTEDVYKRDTYAGGRATDPIQGGSGHGHVLRGGGWDHDPRTARCAFRHGYRAAIGYGGPALSVHAFGFRLARSN